MGTTRIKVIDLSSEKQEIKTSRKHARLAASLAARGAKRAEKLAGPAKIKASSPEGALARREEKKTKVKEEKGKTESTSPAIDSLPSVPSVPPVIKTKSAATRKTTHHLGKKYRQASQLIDKNKVYPAREAIDLLYKIKVTRFDPTVELHLNVTDKNIRGSVSLPHPVGKKKEKKILIFSDQKPETGDKQIIFCDEKTIDEIENGKLKPVRDFDQVLAQPKFIPGLTRVAKILGPRGLMPNPKNGTILDSQIQNFIAKIGKKKTGFGFQTDPTAPIIHTKLGKLSAKPAQIEENLKALVAAIGQTKIKKAFIKSTMSPGIKVDLATLPR
ncbi:hypothetical protein A2697_05060 [Candidatus Curtissbacteria bacterium RIFCSPHIGHO2_01_FULL_41_44]|uniref:Ribosomal protein n=1 Tax=Candidatus Curtissbacteria bacterium RIFCSPLOWO2_01_FULL_42_50 TaxID=1797730 RepID=A0A1F5H5W8_9BACT|nr:MAG: hypothetical protein A2697_05060 [Candidatus Curtissbacteria bacterium RIFCSPHIGHO2_01_FULL_41_44]OGD93796.1 MAG: hypothetical protein A3C33_03655 [Candidatus Curtissbacteria bacterium RIFCSPHIGHO2_02_FULL_42_58]OGD96820.1 MAG: hypothetical protein A3E71_02845 [Candidatus Curtissbacteria bacterium RIFCSPHIGHO2_12_FULL_42_33]OGD99444.1 MAG: hypothetical protein A3B54_00935 [Candidatus Curtissbacteria bacterium RIFCSPLOWO2_01_FULL_42_50]OGE03705.1 MAG: hypothetical protein A3G16_02435 [Ca